MPQSTLGYEKLFNWAFADLSEDEFVEKVLADQPIPPRYFAVMKRINRTAAQPAKSAAPKNIGLDELEEARRKKTPIVDTRPAERFATGHIPGTLNVPLGKSFLNWMGAFVPEDREFILITEADADDAIKPILHDLCKIGLTRVRGVFRGETFREWKSRGGKLETVEQLEPATLQNIAGDQPQIVDVRSPEEWSHGHLPGAVHIPLAALPERLGELDPSSPIVLHCKGGGRSSIAASFLQGQGMSNVSNLVGGYEGWKKEGFPTVDGKPERAVARGGKKE